MRPAILSVFASCAALAGCAAIVEAPPPSVAASAPPPPGYVSPLAFDAAGALVPPKDTDKWVLLGSTLALSYENDPSSSFNTVKIDPASYDAYITTGRFPVGTMMELEIRTPAKDVNPARDGTFAGALRGRSLHVKDEKAGPGTWTFYGFSPSGAASAIPRAAGCYSCHDKHAPEDTVFTQFYPVLKERRAALR